MAIKRGRPKGSKSKYNMSDKALRQRVAAPLKTGEHSVKLAEVMSMSGGLNDPAVNDVRKEMYLTYLQNMMSAPEAVLADTLAKLKASMDMQETINMKDGRPLTKDMIAAADAATRLANALARLQGRFKSQIEVVHRDFDDMVIDIGKLHENNVGN